MDGGDVKGGGNGRGGRLAKRAMPVSNRKGNIGIEALSCEEGGRGAEANHLSQLTRHGTRSTGSDRDNDLGIPAKDEEYGLRIPNVNAGAVPSSCLPQPKVGSERCYQRVD